jgi:hypothetical protein
LVGVEPTVTRQHPTKQEQTAMTMTNEELVRKAVITTDALASSGKLNPAQSDRFIDYVVDQSVLKNNARTVRFRNESLDIDKIGIGRRMALPKAEAQDPALRRGVTTSKVSLTPKEIIVPFEIGDVFKEINIEGDSIEDHIIQLMAKQLANDMEELFITGDTLGPARLESDLKEGGDTTRHIKDTYIALANGWSRLADSGHVVDANASNIGLSIFGQMLRNLPTKFRRNKNELRWFLSPDLWQLYIEKLATRATALGDSAAGGGSVNPFGIQAVPLPLWDLNPIVVEHITLNGTTAVALRYGPVTNLVVHDSALGATATTPYIVTTDYIVDTAAGTIARTGGGAISDGQVVKVTYNAGPQIILTHQMNFILGIGRDIRIEKDRDIYKGVNQYAITAKVAVQFEEVDAIVKAKDIGTGI